MTSSRLVLAFVLVAACGDDKKGARDIDAAPGTDVPQSTCTAPASVSAVSNLGLFYMADRDTVTAGNQEQWKAIGEMDQSSKRDLLWIELFEGTPPEYTTLDFPATPFTVQLTGNETDYLKCSTCVSMTTDADPATLGPGNVDYVDDYQARSGTVTINTLTATEISGTLTNINFAHVDNTANGSVLNPSGCTSTLASLNFTAMVTPVQVNGRTGYRVTLGTGKRPIRH